MVHSASGQHLHSTSPFPTPYIQLQSILQSAKKALNPALVHPPPQSLVGFVLALQLVLALFLLLWFLSFLLLPVFSSLLVLSSSTLVLPSVLVLLTLISVFLPVSSYFLSSSTLLYVSYASSSLLLLKLLS